MITKNALMIKRCPLEQIVSNILAASSSYLEVGFPWFKGYKRVSVHLADQRYEIVMY